MVHFSHKQVDTLIDVLGRMDAERKQHKKEGRFQALYNVSRLMGESLDLQTVLDQRDGRHHSPDGRRTRLSHAAR